MRLNTLTAKNINIVVFTCQSQLVSSAITEQSYELLLFN